MQPQDIVTTPNIEGFKIVAYLGVVAAREDSYDAVINKIIEQAEALGANKVVGFQLVWQSPQRFTGFGTAVRAEPN
jgi:uncharacterized protein YbjQ (UPF0145 family)